MADVRACREARYRRRADQEGRRSLSNAGLPRTDCESLFWVVFAASENPMVIVEANRWVVSANGALQRLLSRTEEELVDRAIDEAASFCRSTRNC